MSKEIQAQGTYSVKDTGDMITYDFAYLAIDSVADAVDSIGEDKVKSCVQRMLKLDANNTAREKAKAVNGHSTRAVMSEEDKATAKVQRQTNKALLDMLKEKGISSIDGLKDLL